MNAAAESAPNAARGARGSPIERCRHTIDGTTVG